MCNHSNIKPGQLSRQSMGLLIPGSWVRAPRWATSFFFCLRITYVKIGLYFFSIYICVPDILRVLFMRLNISSHNIVYLFLQVIFRMNLLTFLLCLVMNRPYQFYYFVPSISFWFIVQFIVLLLPPQVSNRHLLSTKDIYGE